MTPVSDHSYGYLILPAGYRLNHEEVTASDGRVVTYRSIQVIQLQAGAIEAFMTDLALPLVMKVMDDFYLFDYGEETDEIYRSFFDYISSRYEHLIDKKLNSELIAQYFTRIEAKFPAKAVLQVLDLGSGSGISAIVKKENPTWSRISLYGHDISPQMESLSKQAGLQMLNARTLARHEDYYFDAVFGSYSFHFIKGRTTYELIWQKLRIGGIVIANFHKRIGLENALEFFESVRAEVALVATYGKSEIYQFRKTASPFISQAETQDIIAGLLHAEIETGQLLKYLIRYALLPSYELEGSLVFLKADVVRLKPFFSFLTIATWEYGSLELYDKIYVLDCGGIRLEFSRENRLSHEEFNPALLIALLIHNDDDRSNISPIYFPIGESVRVTIRSAKLKLLFEQANVDNLSIESARATIFANSASYMGSKKSLRHFLFAAIKSLVPSSYVALDLMCGAGAVSSILAMRYPTWVSDAMSFSRILAVVQGSGFSTAKAELVLEKLRPYIIQNLLEAEKWYEPALIAEDDAFHRRIGPDNKLAYSEFCRQYAFDNPDYQEHYRVKQSQGQDVPFELFAIAYSNIFFGVKQSLQIDSLRYAIEQLQDPGERIWALGAMIATVSAVGNTYAGHFAQPKYKDAASLSDNEFIRLVEQRSLSVLSEFEARLRAFAHESQSKQLSLIQPIDGPWPKAVAGFVKKFKTQNKFVYIDAPYTRDEYSRYYHVLETLVDYKYYNLTGLGRIPDKKSGARFRSNFFTRDVGKLKREFLGMFTVLLENDCSCGWSYSNSAAADCLEIIYEVVARTQCSVESFEIPYEYKGQGGRAPKQIKEYYIHFSPKPK
ncbi:class I SAM-dependent methyltransferase [Mucilaginibacter gotjawali]|nr:class I SAM-dependent methyltransferase [Mucilaginibacter gotjawali]